MPVQAQRRPNVFTYGQNDTAPDLVYTLRDPDGDIIDLTSLVGNVYITVAHSQWSHYYYRTNPVVDRDSVTVQDAANGVVAWTPKAGDLAIVGMFDFIFEIDWAGDASSVQTVRALSYDHIHVQAPAGGRRDPLT